MTVFEFYQNNTLLSLVWLSTTGLLIFNLVKSKNAKYKTLTAQQVIMQINQHDAVIFDVRSNEEFRKGHILHAHHVTSSDIGKNNLKPYEKYKSKLVIVVCASGFTAQAQANALYKVGFEEVAVLKNGLVGWREAHLPVTKA